MNINTDKSKDLDNTLEDGAWLDSFDKLLEPRPVLRELNILKKEVHASFNRDSSVENSINSKGNESSLLKPSQEWPNDLNEDIQGKSNSISTPLVHRGFKVDPFKCSLSPIGAWRLLYFDKGKNKRLNCTPLPPSIQIVECDELVKKTAFNTIQSQDSIPTLNRQTNRFQHVTRTRNTRHVCFESTNGKRTQNSMEKSKKMVTNEKYDVKGDVRVPSLTLQPGKWRKSISAWRRKQVEKHPNNLAGRQSDKRNSSVEFIGFVGTIVGKRKSIFLKPERISENVLRISTPENNEIWERHVLDRCNQRFPLPFEELYSADKLTHCTKIGEGAYGEVFLNTTSKRRMPDANSTVMKVIPIEGNIDVNGEKQKTFEQILPEVVISVELANLRTDVNSANFTCGFVNVRKVTCIKGQYPQHFIKLWEIFDKDKGSENDHPDIFDDTQIYIVLELEFCGRDLESFQFQNAEQTYGALLQIVLTLAVAEQAFQFEHRDLHWGNILLLSTNVKELKFTLDNHTYSVPTKGVKATIIDYTLSRMTFNNCCHYNDISSDEDLFTASGDYQFDIYRMMRDVLGNNWESFEPRTNIFWISYIITKLIDGVKYKNIRSKAHSTYYSKLNNLIGIVMDFNSAIEFSKYLMDSQA
ncbi:PREDICTED: putative serine/threonine-protein kinase haspin homolog [Bactrocera latifrons]|uniref:non-specific serine/threonine protein kinase n=2 Tax=Bactrocera latifrons TaxID=174628 RepID=A0A0K8V645_BACLA|nr:PREDICTED: putative serine/threonine-protein kinase haspin homolog [Bactrocera latifrons]